MLKILTFFELAKIEQFLRTHSDGAHIKIMFFAATSHGETDTFYLIVDQREKSDVEIPNNIVVGVGGQLMQEPHEKHLFHQRKDY